MASGRFHAVRMALTGVLLVAAPTFPTNAAGDAPSAKPAKPAKPVAKAPAAKTASRGAGGTSKRSAALAAKAARTWHTPTPGKTAPVDAVGRPKLVLQGLNFPDRVELTASRDGGGFNAEDMDRAARVLREPSSGNEHPMAPELLDIVYRIQTHFAAQEIRIISGYRTPRHGATSNHGKGRAIDMVVPGTSDEEVAKFARELGFCGVGIYPVSGFVHVDVRERSFFWVDNSGPGKRNRTRGVLAADALRSDARATARGEHPIGPFIVATDVDTTLAAEGHAPHGDDDDEDDAADPLSLD